MTDVALGAVPAPGTGSPESPVGRSEAVAHTAEAGGHALEIQMLRVGAQLLRVGRQAGSRRGATPLLMFNGIGGSIDAPPSSVRGKISMPRGSGFSSSKRSGDSETMATWRTPSASIWRAASVTESCPSTG